MWLNEETRIAQVANINQLPVTDGFTSPPKVELSTLIGEKKPDLSGAWTCNLSIADQHFNQQATRTPVLNSKYKHNLIWGLNFIIYKTT